MSFLKKFPETNCNEFKLFCNKWDTKGSTQPNSIALQIIYLPGYRSLLCLIENIDVGMGLPHDYFIAELICLLPFPLPIFCQSVLPPHCQMLPWSTSKNVAIKLSWQALWTCTAIRKFCLSEDYLSHTLNLAQSFIRPTYGASRVFVWDGLWTYLNQR